MKKLFAVLIFLSSITIGIFLTLILYQEVERQTLESQKEQQEIFLRQLSFSIENYFTEMFHSLDYFSKKKDVIEINNYSKDEFKNFFEAHEHGIRAITRVSENGKIIFTYPIVESAINADISKQQHNKEVLENRKPVISEVFTAVQGYKTIAIVCPIFNNGNFKGAISFLVNYENMVNKIISPIAKQKGVNSILISEKGNQIYFSDNDSNIQTNNKLQFDKTVILKSISDKHSENLEHVINFSGTSNNKNQQKQIIFDKVDLGNTFWVVGVIVNVSDVLKINRG
ncbi:MAG: cache domain-containing protein, partial [Ignavibacteriae bacterium]|nr:cache domain-containing protein [Ignavibacteriota bacterium]